MTDKKLNYQSLSLELDQILENLQSDKIDVDEALKQYQRGMDIVGQLQAYLKESENKVIKIKKKFVD